MIEAQNRRGILAHIISHLCLLLIVWFVNYESNQTLFNCVSVLTHKDPTIQYVCHLQQPDYIKIENFMERKKFNVTNQNEMATIGWRSKDAFFCLILNCGSNSFAAYSVLLLTSTFFKEYYYLFSITRMNWCLPSGVIG